MGFSIIIMVAACKPVSWYNHDKTAKKKYKRNNNNNTSSRLENGKERKLIELEFHAWSSRLFFFLHSLQKTAILEIDCWFLIGCRFKFWLQIWVASIGGGDKLRTAFLFSHFPQVSVIVNACIAELEKFRQGKLS